MQEGEAPAVCAEARGAGKPPLSVSVRALCAFAARQGDLDLRFTPSPTAQQGREGHLLVARRRGESYESEIVLSAVWGDLKVSGRADGYDPRHNDLEEIKTHRGRIEDIPANQQALHRAQARLYGWMFCEARGLEQLTVSRVYLEIGLEAESRVSETLSAAALREFAGSLCERYAGWARSEARHREQRQRWLATLAFPLPAFRPGQRELAAAVWRACRSGERLRVEAPTGLGKTLGTLYPALRAMADRPLDRIAMLSARTTARQVALDAFAQIRAEQPRHQRMPLRVIEIVARERACEHPDKACHGESCPLARGFYDRLPAARRQACDVDLLDQATTREIALAHRICPYFFSMEWLRWCDVAIGDYHYWFDRHAVLAALTAEFEWKVAVLIDEAHQLVARTRAMYSASASAAALIALQPQLPPALRGAVGDLLNQWEQLVDAHTVPSAASDPVETSRWQQLPEPPEDWLRALHRFNSRLGDHVIEQGRAASPTVLEAWFDGLSFASLADNFAEHSLCELSLAEAGEPPEAQGLLPHTSDRAQLTLRNIVPAPFIRPRLELADSVVMFSATLNPPDYDGNLLGLPDSTATLRLASPFDPDRLRVSVLPVSTRITDRARTLPRVLAALAREYHREPGNYLAFFSSFDYLQQAFTRFRAEHPDITTWAQTRSMTDASRTAFLERFHPEGQGIGFAVLGGAFGEGIDLPGRRLIGAFIATLGMPQVDAVNEAIAARMDKLFDRGHDYTYLIPGLQKVVQAAGRVIRSPEDRGMLMLIDARYSWPRYQQLLPAAWGLG